MAIVISELTGKPVDTYGEAWRAECEARSVLAMPTRGHRNNFLTMVAKSRGQAAADELRRMAENLHYARKHRAEAAAQTAASPQMDLLSA